MPEPTETTIDAWISPATTSLSPDDIKIYSEAIANAASSVVASNSSDLVTIAYGISRPDAREWLTSLIRSKKTDFPTAKNEDLLARVACCIELQVLNSGRGPAALVGLLTQSALFIGAHAPIEELADHANAAVTSAAISSRQRPAAWVPIATEVATLLAAEPVEPAEGVAKEPEGYEKAISRLASAVDLLASQSDKRAKAVDEEYNALWWSYTDRSISAGTRWQEIKPIGRRLVLAAHELGRQMVHHPGPPVIAGLLGAALGDQVDKDVSLADVALAAAAGKVDVAARAKDPLLPISSAVAQIAELGSDGDTWKEVVARSLGLNPELSSSALQAALQLFREVEIGKYLE